MTVTSALQENTQREPDTPAAPVRGQVLNLVSAGMPDKPPFPVAPEVPVICDPAWEGVRMDFNDGCRITLPEGDWNVTIRDGLTRNILYTTRIGAGSVVSSKRYFVPFEVEVDSGERAVVRHRFDARGQKVLILFPVGTLGDLMGWFPYAVKFQRRHQCQLTVAMSALLIPLFESSYPEIGFVTPEQVKADRYYATYRVGLFFNDEGFVYAPCDFRHVGLHRTAGHILGVDPREERPTITLKDDTRPIEEPYVCIAAQASTQCKHWNNPDGWREVVAFLKAAGYRVICIDQKPCTGRELIWNHIPYGSENETGDRPLTERARWLRHAEFFVGLSSGLAWLAWAMNTPVVMISGFTHENNEFYTPYRVINYHTCNSCWNDVRVQFDHHDFMWCPRHANTPRQFECTRLITAAHVKAVIGTVPGFGEPSLRGAVPRPKKNQKI